MEEHKAKQSDLSDQLLLSRRELFAERERVRDLHVQAETTYINLTLIQRDFVMGCRRALLSIGETWDNTAATALPYWNMVMDLVEPLVKQLGRLADEHISPVVAVATEKLKSAYKLHIHTFATKFIFPYASAIAGPLTKLARDGQSSLGLAVSQSALSLRHYLELVEPQDPPLQNFLIRQLNVVAENSDTIAYVIMFLGPLLILCFQVWFSSRYWAVRKEETLGKPQFCSHQLKSSPLHLQHKQSQ
uniref:Uncharacterized protein n=1 Tax=Cyclophora tenuis TaxID=216820 RepID=A0A7S1CXK2_CYCTE